MILSYLFFESVLFFVFVMFFIYFGLKNYKKIKEKYLVSLFIFIVLMLGKIILNIQNVTFGIYINIGKIILFFNLIWLIFAGGKNEK